MTRGVAGLGATYVADAVPGRHTRGGTYDVEMAWPKDPILYGLGLPKSMEKYNSEGKGKAHAIVTGLQHLINASGACMFAVDGLNFPLRSDERGHRLGSDPGELIKAGYRIATLQHAFNLREGFKPTDFTMPPRVYGNPPLKVGSLKGITVDVEDLKKQYYEAMGFDPVTGEIRKDRIEALGLKNIP